MSVNLLEFLVSGVEEETGGKFSNLITGHTNGEMLYWESVLTGFCKIAIALQYSIDP